MSDGDIGDGIEFWASIRIRGELEKQELKKVMEKVREALSYGGAEGDVVHAARITVSGNELPNIAISLKKSNSFLARKK